MKNLNFWQVDAFTNTPFKGNPAAVVTHKEQLDDELMQNIAIEMNLSETAFVQLRKNERPLLRWFTSAKEVDLCGHATLASAHICLTEILDNKNEISFDTKFVGTLDVKKSDNGYTMDFPQRPGQEITIKDIPQYVLNALGDTPPIYAKKSRDLMLVYENEQVLRNISPDFISLNEYKEYIIVTAKSDNSEYDFISRFFCPDDAVPEDPVTGSSHCTLAPYWSGKLGKTKLKSYQASKRGGEMFLKLTDNNRLHITGQAVTVINGKIMA